LHCASLLRTIFASFACANERVYIHNIQAKLDSEVNARFLLDERGDLYFLFYNFGVQIITFKLTFSNKIE